MKSVVVELGGIEAILVAMRLHEQNDALLESACRALRNVMGTSSEHRNRIVRAGGIQTVISVMRKHRKTANVLEAACWLLWNLALCHANHQRSIVNSGGLPIVIDAMRTHSGVASLQDAASGALRVLTEVQPSRLRQEDFAYSPLYNTPPRPDALPCIGLPATASLKLSRSRSCASTFHGSFRNPGCQQLSSKRTRIRLPTLQHSDVSKQHRLIW